VAIGKHANANEHSAHDESSNQQADDCNQDVLLGQTTLQFSTRHLFQLNKFMDNWPIFHSFQVMEFISWPVFHALQA